jgi:hypothetical protein
VAQRVVVARVEASDDRGHHLAFAKCRFPKLITVHQNGLSLERHVCCKQPTKPMARSVSSGHPRCITWAHRTISLIGTASSLIDAEYDRMRGAG